MRIPSTRMTWCAGSTRAPNRRTVSPSTSTRPSPISSSQCRRLPTPAAASTFCSRTPPGTSMRLSRPSSSRSKSSGSSPERGDVPEAGSRGGAGGRPPAAAGPRRAGDSREGTGGRPPGPAEPRPAGESRGARGGRSPGLAESGPLALIDRILDVLDVLGQEGGEIRELGQAGQAEPLQEGPGGAVEASPGLRLGARLLDQSAQGERAQHAVAVDPADGRHPGPVHRLPVSHHGQGFQGGLGQPDLLAVPDEPLHHRCALGPGVVPPAAGHLAQVEAALLGVVGGGEVAQGRRDFLARALEDLGDDDLWYRFVHHQQDRLEAGPQAGTSRALGRASVAARPVPPPPPPPPPRPPPPGPPPAASARGCGPAATMSSRRPRSPPRGSSPFPGSAAPSSPTGTASSSMLTRLPPRRRRPPRPPRQAPFPRPRSRTAPRAGSPGRT